MAFTYVVYYFTVEPYIPWSEILIAQLQSLPFESFEITDLGFNAYTENIKSNIDIFCITAALMFGTAGLPHVIVRFFTVPKVRDARKSAGYALIFIAIPVSYTHLTLPTNSNV